MRKNQHKNSGNKNKEIKTVFFLSPNELTSSLAMVLNQEEVTE